MAGSSRAVTDSGCTGQEGREGLATPLPVPCRPLLLSEHLSSWRVQCAWHMRFLTPRSCHLSLGVYCHLGSSSEVTHFSLCGGGHWCVLLVALSKVGWGADLCRSLTVLGPGQGCACRPGGPSTQRGQTQLPAGLCVPPSHGSQAAKKSQAPRGGQSRGGEKLPSLGKSPGNSQGGCQAWRKEEKVIV